MSGMHEVQSSPVNRNLKNPENQTNSNGRDATPGSDLWTDGLICAFEYVKIPRRISRSKYGSKIQSLQQVEGDSMKKQVPEDRVYGASDKKLNRKHLLESESLVELRSGHITSLDNQVDHQSSLSDHYHMAERFSGSRWVPIGWARISELVQTVQMDAGWALPQQFELLDNEDERSVADLATPYWEQPAGPIWWCHVAAGHQHVDTWLSNSHWLHPAIRTALRDESRLISERMKYLLYEVDCLFDC